MIKYSIQQFQEEFDRLFQPKYPFLKIVFHLPAGAKQIQQNLIEWRGARKSFSLADLGIEDVVTLQSFQEKIKMEFGLELTCYRKMNQSWLPANHTKHLSFEQQNKIGLELALSKKLY